MPAWMRYRATIVGLSRRFRTRRAYNTGSRTSSGPPIAEGARAMALGTQPHGKMLDYEQYIDHQLSRTRAQIKTTDILIAALILATAALGVLFVEVVLDHAFGLPVWLRRIVLFGGMGGAAGLRRPCGSPGRSLSRVNGFYAAKTIEDADPAFKNSLINYLDLRKHRDEIPRRALAAIEAKAVGDLTRVEIDAVVNQRRLIQTGLRPVRRDRGGLLPTTRRSRPRASSTRPSGPSWPTWSGRPTPGSYAIKPGDDPELIAGGGRHERAVLGRDPRASGPPRSTLHYSVDGGKFYLAAGIRPGPEPLRPLADHPPERPAGHRLLHHRRRRRVAPLPRQGPPRADGHRRCRSTTSSPPTPARPTATGVEGGAVEAIEGTDVTVHARTNQPAQVGLPRLRQGATSPAMDVSRRRPTTQELVGRFRVESDGLVHDQVPDDRRPDEPRPGRLRHPRDQGQPRRRSASSPPAPGSSCRATARSRSDRGRRRLRRQGAQPDRPQGTEPLVSQGPAGEQDARPRSSPGPRSSTWPG